MDDLAQPLLVWFDRHGRHDLPWQHPRTPYRVWVSEVMLQQTRVTSVIDYFQRFTAKLPDLPTLAAASTDEVLALWSGLGYYRRAHHLHAAAKRCVEQHGGKLPHTMAALVALPGIGRSTAAAILALAHGQPQAILDGNVKRVLSRYHAMAGWPGAPAVESRLWTHAQAHTPATRTAAYTQAIMDLGATVCTRAHPNCAQCPLAQHCIAYRKGLTATIPAARPTHALPTRHTVLVVLRDAKGRILLQRRPPTGVWPGLWSLPEATNQRAARAIAHALAETNGVRARALPVIQHTFTHFKLCAIPFLWMPTQLRDQVAETGPQRWCGPSELDRLGTPAPIRTLLAQLFTTGMVPTPR